MRMLTVLALFATSLVIGSAYADDAAKKDKELTGSYLRKSGEMDLKLEFKKDKMMDFHVKIGEAGCLMATKYTKDKDGVYHCEITKFTKVGDFPVEKEKGYKFTFKLAVKDKAIVMSDLEGADIDDNAKKTIEGEYEAAKGD